MSERKAACAHCNVCGEHLSENGFCHNKQCSRHGRTNDYLAGDPHEAANGDKRPPTSSNDLEQWRARVVALEQALEKARVANAVLAQANAALTQAMIDIRAQLGQMLIDSQATLRTHIAP